MISAVGLGTLAEFSPLHLYIDLLTTIKSPNYCPLTVIFQQLIRDWHSLFWPLPCMQGRVKETYSVQQRVAAESELHFANGTDPHADDQKARSDLEPPQSPSDWDANDGGFFGAGCQPGLSRRSSK